MTSRPNAIPLRADYGAVRRRGADCLVKAATVFLLSNTTTPRTPTKDILRIHYPDDKAVEWLTRAATTPASDTVQGWAKDLLAMGVADFVNTLSPTSAAATLLARGLQFNSAGVGKIKVPSFTSDPNSVFFLGEGKGIPVVQLDLSGGVYLDPRKAMVICVFSRQVFEYSIPSIETVVRAVLSESVARKLDAALFDTAAAAPSRPAGLLNGISAITPATAASTVEATLIKDVQNLASAVNAVSGGAPLVFVASPAQALALQLYLGARNPHEVLSCSALAAGVVVCIASNCLCSAIDPLPRFELASEGTIMLDTTPQDNINTTAVAGSVKSLFQSDLLSLRMLLRISWALRSPNGLAWTTVTTW
jgi:Phage capsid family